MGPHRRVCLRACPRSCLRPVSYRANAAVQLYRMQTSAPKVLARIARAPSMVLLELTQEALQLSLLEPCLVATVLFVCGHNID